MDRLEPFDLAEHGFIFGIEKIDPKLGRIEAYATLWKFDGDKIKEPIDMVDCEDLINSND